MLENYLGGEAHRAEQVGALTAGASRLPRPQLTPWFVRRDGKGGPTDPCELRQAPSPRSDRQALVLSHVKGETRGRKPRPREGKYQAVATCPWENAPSPCISSSPCKTGVMMKPVSHGGVKLNDDINTGQSLHRACYLKKGSINIIPQQFNFHLVWLQQRLPRP